MLSSMRMVPAARDDLIAIWHYTETQWGEPQADHYLRTIEKAYALLYRQPMAGRAVPELDASMRVYHCEHHFIFYVPDAEGIIVMAFLHERMDMIAHLLGRLKK